MLTGLTFAERLRVEGRFRGYIDEAAQFLSEGQVSIHFVQEQGWLVLGHQAQEDRGSQFPRVPLSASSHWRFPRNRFTASEPDSMAQVMCSFGGSSSPVEQASPRR